MRRSFSSQPALFATHELLDHPALGALDDIEAVIDWDALTPLLPQGKGDTGRLGYPALTLFRALLLGLWHNLSDVKLEAQLARDLMFRKFCRLELDGGVPQASTIGRFRIALEQSGRMEAVLTEINAQLGSSGKDLIASSMADLYRNAARGGTRIHAKAYVLLGFDLSHRRGPPGLLRHAPVDPFQKHR